MVAKAVKLTSALAWAIATFVCPAAAGPISELQYLLVWAGHYSGPIDGAGSEVLRQAIVRSSRGGRNEIDESRIRTLLSTAEKRIALADYTLTKDEQTGVVVGLPRRIATEIYASGAGTRYANSKRGFSITTYKTEARSKSLISIFNALIANRDEELFIEKAYRGDHFSFVWSNPVRIVAARYYLHGNNVSGVLIELDRTISRELDFLVMASHYDSGGSEVFRLDRLLPQGSIPELVRRVRASLPSSKSGSSSGSGFWVSDRGHVLTNAHVVRGCNLVTLNDAESLKLVAYDEKRDLALLQSEESSSQSFARFAAADARLGERVAVFGFPLRSILADQLNMTRGDVSSLAGLGGDINQIQITAPVQRGNSGGAVVDDGGRVIGVVTSKLDALGIAPSLGGDLPQAVNFAVKGGAVTKFLMRSGVQPRLSDRTTPYSGPELAELGRGFSVAITCMATEPMPSRIR